MMAQMQRAMQQNYDYYKSKGMSDEDALRKSSERQPVAPQPVAQPSWVDTLKAKVIQYFKMLRGD
jgi:hypothetical protein